MSGTACKAHKPAQHRDAKPPWCDECGLTSDFKIPESRLEKLHKGEESFYLPPGLQDLVNSITYKPGWIFQLQYSRSYDGSGGLALHIISETENSFDFNIKIRVRHEFLVPPASWNRDVWAAWIFDRVRDVETHEAGEFFRVNGVREFAPHHSNGEDPYRVWHVSDWATAAKSSGQD